VTCSGAGSREFYGEGPACLFCARSAAPTPAAKRTVPYKRALLTGRREICLNFKVPGKARRELAFGKGFSSLHA